MLKHRLIVGVLLALWGFAVLFIDTRFAPWYPILFFFGIVVTFALAFELQNIFPSSVRPRSDVLFGCMLLVVLANWTTPLGLPGHPITWISGAIVTSLVISFLVEARRYREPGTVTIRLALTYFALGYVGLFGSFLLQLRWYHPGETSSRGASTIALLLAIFVPKCCDIGAYCIGRLFGKHRMTPLLSPKKTWEGAIGGLVFSALSSLSITHGLAAWLSLDSSEQPVLPLRFDHIAGMPGWAWSLLFGVLIGVAGMLGDLMESLIKRDLHQKDAATTLPGFGGLLDVFDSILFSAPLTYGLLHWAAWAVQQVQ